MGGGRWMAELRAAGRRSPRSEHVAAAARGGGAARPDMGEGAAAAPEALGAFPRLRPGRPGRPLAGAGRSQATWGLLLAPRLSFSPSELCQLLGLWQPAGMEARGEAGSSVVCVQGGAAAT